MHKINSILGSEWCSPSQAKKHWLSRSEVTSSKISSDLKLRNEHKQFMKKENRLRTFRKGAKRGGVIEDDLAWVVDPVPDESVIAEDDLLDFFARKIEPTVKKLMSAYHEKSLHAARLYISLAMEEMGNSAQWSPLEEFGLNISWCRIRIRKHLKAVMEDYYSKE